MEFGYFTVRPDGLACGGDFLCWADVASVDVWQGDIIIRARGVNGVWSSAKFGAVSHAPVLVALCALGAGQIDPEDED